MSIDGAVSTKGSVALGRSGSLMWLTPAKALSVEEEAFRLVVPADVGTRRVLDSRFRGNDDRMTRWHAIGRCFPGLSHIQKGY
jgi:hypothetical protein